MPVKIHLTGQRFERLLVLEEGSRGNCSQIKWRCKCDCGNFVEVLGRSLRAGRTKSCGCYGRESLETRPLKHGHTTQGRSSKTYQSWEAMINRCSNSNNKYWDNYGGKGISVCDRWKNFQNFLDDMGLKPDNLTLDRIDNSKGYSKENCRWATRTQQNRNKKNNKLITFDGICQPISAWAEQKGLPDYVLRSRIRRGWNLEKALLTPVIK